ncbi:amidohydrolase family protein [Asanoa iriomotensis]|uniref:amidohydrolase family protein n=1 Tax=Asanoa iriomotensis TaxID=234613 RepID=UPI001942EEFE|nr:amidohydrolase family protein [Asanoa iriomotensis]
MRIDVHCHFLPESGRRAHERGEDWHGTVFSRDENGILVSETGPRRMKFGSPLHFEPMEQRVARMDARGVDIEMLSMLPPLFRYEVPAADNAAAARDVNDELSALTKRFPGRFLGLGTLPLQDVDASVTELERLMALPGMAGVAIGTNVNGVNLDADELAPFFTAAQDLDAFVFIHPMDQRGREALGSYYLRNAIGNPFETTVAAASLMMSGRLAQVPRLHICLAHGGGYTAAALGRFAHTWQVRNEVESTPDRSPALLYRRFFYDSLTHDERTLRHLVDFVGVDRVVLGTDFPADMGMTNAALEIRASDAFTDDEKAAILGGNLATALKLTPAPAA